LPRGRDGARLLGNVSIPFAQLFFDRDVIGSFVGPVLRPPRDFGPDELQRWATNAGFTMTERAQLTDQDPCEMHVQARFAPLFRRSGWSRSVLAGAFVATFRAARFDVVAEYVPSTDQVR
jgi:hypothetical protein